MAVQLHPSTLDPTAGGAIERVCRRGRGGLLVLVLLLWAAPVFWWAVSAPVLVTALCALPAGLITPALLGTWRNRGRAGNWALAVAPDRLWLNLRSGDHRYDFVSESVVSLDYADVREAARYQRTFTAEDSDGDSVRHKRVYLELRLKRPIPGEIEDALKRVYRERPERRYLGGLIKVTSNITQFPARIVDPTTIRIHWSGQEASLRPGLTRVLELLSRRIAMGAPVVDEDDDWRSLDEPSFDAYLVELARSGQTVAAVSAARERRALTLTQAREVVERLAGQAGA